MARHKNPVSFSLAVQKRIEARIEGLTPGSPQLRRALMEIGRYLELEIKRNIQRQGIVDTSKLLESVTHKIENKFFGGRLTVGSIGVIYARFHEFGSGQVDDRQRAAMFARLREEGKIGTVNKGLLTNNTFKARPYIRPVRDQKKHRKRITKIIRDYVRRL
jgi:hypothetical protein